MCFGVLHLGDHNIACGTGEYQGAQKYEALVKEISEAFAVADFPKTILLLGKYFGTSTYSLTSLFADERRKVLNMIMEPTLREAEAAYSSIYEHHAPLIRFLKGAGTPLPKGLALAAELCLNAKLRGALQGEGLEPEVVRPLLEEARLAGATLDATALGLLLAVNIEHLAEQLLEQPDDLSRMERLNKRCKTSPDIAVRGQSLEDPKHLLQAPSHILVRLQGKGRPGRQKTLKNGYATARSWPKTFGLWRLRPQKLQTRV